MPTIINDEARLTACNEIDDALNSIRIINSMLEDDGTTIAVVSGEGKGAMKIGITGKEKTKLVGLLGSYRDRLVKDCVSKAEKFRLEFSQSEQDTMDGKVVTMRRNAASKGAEDEEQPL